MWIFAKRSRLWNVFLHKFRIRKRIDYLNWKAIRNLRCGLNCIVWGLWGRKDIWKIGKFGERKDKIGKRKGQVRQRKELKVEVRERKGKIR